MMKARLLTVSAMLLIVACKDNNTPTSISAPVDPSKIISDGAHGGNKDFFFLPPMVPLPLGNPDFELGKFNNTLGPSLKIEICKLKRELQNNVQVLPKTSTLCDGDPIKKFAPGSVQVVNLPLKQNGWWTVFGLPADGFYYALWDTRQSNLSTSDYYRIKVFIDGLTEPLGVADVDPMSSLREWKYTLTGQVIQLVDDVMLPITFRVENGGGSALCGGASVCASATINNSSPTGFQTVTVDGGAGAVAGVKFPNGWLPANGPQNVVVTVAAVDVGTTDPVTGAETKPCHVGLKLQQFPGCFNFTTTPHLPAIDESGRQFAAPVQAAVCYSLQGSGDPREKFAEMYASGPNEPPHPLEDASDAGILAANARNCSTTAPVIGAAPSNDLVRYARAGWNRIKSGAKALFGVRTAYAVDLGLGGFMTEFSNVGPALQAEIAAVGSTELSASPGDTLQAYVRLTGSNHHDGQHENSVGLSGLTVHFAEVDGDGALAPMGETPDGTATQLDVTTDDQPIDAASPVSGGGYAAVNWRVPRAPGVYHLSVDGPALGGPVTFNVTVRAAAQDLGFLAGFPGSAAMAINDAGHIVGVSYTATSPSREAAFIWMNGQMVSLGNVGGTVTEAYAINSNDEVVGFDGSGGQTGTRAWRWKDGIMTALDVLPNALSSFATGINSSGQIVGYSTVPTDHYRSWIWQNGTYVDIGVPPGHVGFGAMGINDAGTVIGWDGSEGLAWTWQNGTFTALPVPGTDGLPRAINAAGVVAGNYRDSDGHYHAVRWENGAMTELGHLPGDTDSQADGISRDGTIVGLSYIPGSATQGFVAHAFLWRNGRMIELPGLTANFAEAMAINSSGTVVGQSGGNPAAHATMWQAAPSP